LAIDRIRVLVPVSTFPRWQNDTEPSFIHRLCRELIRNGIEVDVIAPHAPGAKTNETMDDITVYRYRYLPETHQTLAYSGGILSKLHASPYNYLQVPFLLIAQYLCIRKHLNTGNYDIIHAHWLIPQGLISVLACGLIRRCTRPIVCTMHGSDLYALRSRIFTILKRYAMRHSTHLCAVSNAISDICKSMGVDGRKLSVIPMGVDLKNLFVPDGGIQRKHTRIIYVGRLVKEKGLATLIDAVAIAGRSVTDLELLIIGDGPERQTLQDHVNDLELNNKILFTGAIEHENLPQFYNSASLAVLPSMSEGFGLTLVEALGCECAVIASDLESLRDVVITDKTGLTVEPGNIQQLGEAIMELLANPERRRRLASQGREYVLQHYDWSIVGEKYSTLLRSLAAATARDRHGQAA
jgi:glycosyltransferase involved in cell wall biosynthesis